MSNISLEDAKRLLYLRRGNEYLIKDNSEFKSLDIPITIIHKTFANYPKQPHAFEGSLHDLINTSLICTECDPHSKVLGLNKIRRWLLKKKVKFEESVYFEGYEQFIFDFCIELNDDLELLLNYNDTSRCKNFMFPDNKELLEFCNENEFNLLEILHTDFDEINNILNSYLKLMKVGK